MKLRKELLCSFGRFDGWRAFVAVRQQNYHDLLFGIAEQGVAETAGFAGVADVDFAAAGFAVAGFAVAGFAAAGFSPTGLTAGVSAATAAGVAPVAGFLPEWQPLQPD